MSVLPTVSSHKLPLFNTEKLEIDGHQISPMNFTSKILLDEWKLGDTEEELTVMRVTLKGENANGEQETLIFDLHDEYDMATQTSSMARTTGYSATAAANMFLAGLFSEKGVFPPELVGKHEICFDYIMEYLKDRGIEFVSKG